MNVHVQMIYNVVHHSQVKLPKGRNWKDVKTFFVQWNTAYLTFKDGSSSEQELNDEQDDHQFFKHPDKLSVFELDKDREWADYDKELTIPPKGV